MLEQKVIPKKKKELPRTVLRGRVLTGESEGNWYTAPFIWIPADVAEIQKRDERYVTRETFHVALSLITSIVK